MLSAILDIAVSILKKTKMFKIRCVRKFFWELLTFERKNG